MTPDDFRAALKALGFSYQDFADLLNEEAEPGQARLNANSISRMVNGYKTKVGGKLVNRPARVDLAVAAYVRLRLELCRMAT